MRVRMVTRTIKTTTVQTMEVNTETATIEYNNYEIVGEYPVKELEKIVRKEVEEETNRKFVSIVKTVKNEQIYGMPEEEFILYAKPIER